MSLSTCSAEQLWRGLGANSRWLRQSTVPAGLACRGNGSERNLAFRRKPLNNVTDHRPELRLDPLDPWASAELLGPTVSAEDLVAAYPACGGYPLHRSPDALNSGSTTPSRIFNGPVMSWPNDHSARRRQLIRSTDWSTRICGSGSPSCVMTPS